MDLHVKYRPQEFSQVVGHADILRSLQGALKKEAGHALLFSGPSGTGKTTLARIVARSLGCTSQNIIEVDAATHTGVDAMRDLKGGLIYSGLGKSTKKMVILDECHALSGSAWQSLLKLLEEPPKHLYWALCTTELTKVPKTIQTRCLVYTLDPLSVEEIASLLIGVASDEGMEVPEDVLDMVAQSADGSPRKALTALAKVADAKTRKQAARILKEVDADDSAVIDFCRLLLQTSDWSRLAQGVKRLEGANPESVRRVVLDYMTKVAMGSKDARRAAGVMNIIGAFSQPYPSGGQLYPLLESIASISFNE